MALTIWGYADGCDRVSVCIGAGYDPRRHSSGRLCDGVQRSRAGVRWCALLGAIGHGSRMILMTSGLNIEWSTFMASMLVGHHWYSMVALVSGASESVYRGGVIPMFPGISGLYRNDFGGKNQPVRLQRTVDDYPVNQLSYSFIDCWCVIHRSFHSWIMVVPQAPSRIKIASLKHTDERQPPLLRVLL